MVCLENIDLDTLISIIKKKKTVCFGAGLQGRRVAEFFENWGLENQLLAFVDNSNSKIGGKIQCEKYDYPILSLTQAKESLTTDILVLITCLNYEEVYNQLEKEEIKGWTYIAFDKVAEAELLKSNYVKIIKETNIPIIPKIIHYVWFGEEMPESMKLNIKKWKELCPEYTFYEWNESNYDISNNKYIKEAYDNEVWGFVSDYIRLDVVYRYGGIYLDTDVEMIRKPDELLYQQCFGCVDCSMTMNLGSGFGAVPGTEIIRELRDYYNDICFIKEDGTINNTSCSTYSFQVLKKYGLKINNQLQKVREMNIYPMIFQGACQYTKTKKVAENTFFVHYGSLSWFNKGK